MEKVLNPVTYPSLGKNTYVRKSTVSSSLNLYICRLNLRPMAKTHADIVTCKGLTVSDRGLQAKNLTQDLKSYKVDKKKCVDCDEACIYYRCMFYLMHLISMHNVS